MYGHKAFAHVAAAGMVVGAAVAPITQSAHTELTLLAADTVLSGSDIAIIVGGTTEPTPSTAFAQAAEELYLHPLGFDGGATGSAVCDMSGTDPCSAPLQVLTTPELVQQGPSSLTGASDIVKAVENEIAAHPGAFNAEHPLTVFGYSQGATAGSIAMTQLAHDGVPSADVHFVFIGDPDTPGGIWPNVEADLAAAFGRKAADAFLDFIGAKGVVGVVTPDDLYPATIYTLDTDGVADFQADLQAGGFWGLFGHFLVQHVEYMGLTPSEVANAVTSTGGDLTYVDIADDIDNADAWFNALGHGLLDSGILQSVFTSLEDALRSLL